ncbi:MAG: pyridoxine 5'-phosphate synthase [Omnitrophica WOR_2 bacterium RIFCSPHIGHO2_02_FULL_68_15]|nr:MAG: pyridoxine 5'-phosphate synthase [Omnitrophica WOR_2 bacterium RIFCSPHIGHO2_02_FULL_68_15]
MPQLGVNIDHVATLRQARRTVEPDPVWAAAEAELAGCDSIVCHLREDRRHMQDRDLVALRRTVGTRLNLELAASPEIVAIALRVRPDQATFVPERRQEVTTEGGLDVAAHRRRLAPAIRRLQQRGVAVSLFVDPDLRQLEGARALGVSMVELHTGRYANARTDAGRRRALAQLRAAARQAQVMGLAVNAGHGLTYRNVAAVAALPAVAELNIGHSVIARAVFVGLRQAVREMAALVHGAA